MLHGGHTADSGNSSRSMAASPAGTGFSEATASFIGANASPFLNPTEMIQSGVKVTDPRNTRRTCSTTLTTRITIPVIPSDEQGKLMIVMDADPLSQLPIWVSRVAGTRTTTYDTTANVYYWNELSENGNLGSNDATDPFSWGQILSKFGASDLFSQTKTLGEMSVRHRVVGCAMRANVGVDTTIQRGSIEAGQFAWSDTRDVIARPLQSAGVQTNRLGFWGCDVATTSANDLSSNMKKQRGMSTLLRTCSYDAVKQMLRTAKTQDWGILDSDQGACVRWTDSNSFTFQPTLNRNIVTPSRYFYSNGVEDVVPGIYGPEDNSRNLQFINCNASRQLVNGSVPTFGTNVSKSPLAVIRRTPNVTGLPDGESWMEYFAADNDHMVGLTSGAHNETLATVNYAIGNGTLNDLINWETHFDKGLYIDITGVTTSQWVNVDFVWHIEYEPKNYAMTKGVQSPVDPQFDVVTSMLSDPHQFPIVVKGHSFFSSLWHGIKSAIGFGSKVAQGASSMMQASGIPELQGVGASIQSGLGLATNMYDMVKRQRF